MKRERFFGTWAAACVVCVMVVASATPVLAVPPCPADFNLDGALTVSDIFAFLNAWFAGDMTTDANGTGTLEVADIFTFLDAWFAGCP